MNNCETFDLGKEFIKFIKEIRDEHREYYNCFCGICLNYHSLSEYELILDWVLRNQTFGPFPHLLATSMPRFLGDSFKTDMFDYIEKHGHSLARIRFRGVLPIYGNFEEIYLYSEHTTYNEDVLSKWAGCPKFITSYQRLLCDASFFFLFLGEQNTRNQSIFIRESFGTTFEHNTSSKDIYLLGRLALLWQVRITKLIRKWTGWSMLGVLFVVKVHSKLSDWRYAVPALYGWLNDDYGDSSDFPLTGGVEDIKEFDVTHDSIMQIGNLKFGDRMLSTKKHITRIVYEVTDNETDRHQAS